MLISLNEIKKYVKIPDTVTTADLLELIGSRLVEIEETHDLAPKYQGIYVVKVLQAEPIEGTHLHLCQIDAGVRSADFATVSATPDGVSSATATIGSTTTPTVQVVCGAPNVHAGMLTAWITPGAIVPQTFGHENFRLSVRKLRGYESNGMLAAVDELDLGADHEGIVEIDPKLTFSDPESGETRLVRPGDCFADVFGLNDTIIDVENKSLTHRPDCFGLIGFAREVAGILGQPFIEPDWLDCAGNQGELLSQSVAQSAAPSAETVALTVSVDPALCPRYSCAVFDLPNHRPSKYLTPDAVFLAKAGMRAIDPMVDLTNILMLQTGQPLHAFDYDKLVAVGQTAPVSANAANAKSAKTATSATKTAATKADAAIIVRAAAPDEPLQLLDGKTIACIPEDILITSNGVPVALAGAMGGKNTEIDASTRRVVLESATFSLFHLRKTQMAHGIFSEAITRFTKGQPAAMTLPVLGEALRRLDVQPLALADDYPEPVKPVAIKLSVEQINGLLGTAYDVATIARTLENVGFAVETQPELKVTPPCWRTDIHIPEDVIEEVGRLLGFDNIALTLPLKPFTGTETSPIWLFKQELRHLLSGALRMNELLTYSFVSRSLLEKVGQPVADSYEIVNSISPELECFRQHIAPSLLDKVRENLKAGHSAFTLYELNQVSAKSYGLTPEGTPVVANHLGIVALGDFYQLKAQLLALSRFGLKLDLAYSQMTPGSAAAKAYPYLEPAHSAVFLVGDQPIGAFGEVKPAVLRRFKLDAPVSAAELDLDTLVALPRRLDRSLKLSRFPFVERDLTLKVNADAQFGRFYAKIDAVLSGEGLISETTPLSIYQSAPDSATKNISFHLKFASPDSTLAQEQISDIMDKITVEVVQLGAEIV